MGIFDSLFGGNSTTTQQTSQAPWAAQQPHLQFGFDEARRLYEDQGPSYFPGSSVVGFSPQTEQALQMTEQSALQGSPIDTAGREQMLGTLQGDYLGGSPFFEGAFESQVRPMVQQYSQELLPGLQSSFTGGGTRGGSAEQGAAGRMTDSFTRALSDTGGQLAYQNYANERGMQNNAMMAAPDYAQSRFNPFQTLANVGGAREGLAQAQLTDEVGRHNFEQNVQANKLAQYLGIVGGGFGSEGTSSQPIYRNVGANLLGGAATGAGLAEMFGMGGAGMGGMAGAGALASLF